MNDPWWKPEQHERYTIEEDTGGTYDVDVISVGELTVSVRDVEGHETAPAARRTFDMKEWKAWRETGRIWPAD